MRSRLIIVFVFLVCGIISSCTKDENDAQIDSGIELYAGQIDGLTFYSNLDSLYHNTQDGKDTIFEYDSISIDINQDNTPDVAFVSMNHWSEVYCEFKSINPEFTLFADNNFENQFVIKRYEYGENINEFHTLTSPNLFVTHGDSSVDIRHWNGSDNKYMAFSYFSNNGYTKGLGWIEVSIANYYNFKVHNWGIKESDVRN